jgi:glycosyltransferase involved in cell wall biosynthesis
MRGRSVLIVTQFTPPATFSAGRRAASFAKYLDRLGHRVTLVTSLASGRGGIPGARIVRTPDAIESRLNWRRGHFRSLREGARASYEPAPSRLARLVVPDLSLVGWTPFALRSSTRLAASEAFDCVITSSPPESAHLVGFGLRRRGIPWIADLRDGWAFETTHPDWLLPGQAALDRWLEHWLLSRADLITSVTEPITEDLRQRLGLHAVTLPNGFDPEERVSASPEEVGLSTDRHSLVHTGRMAFAGRSPRPLLEALHLLGERRGDLTGRLEAVFAGPLSTEERELLERGAEGAMIRIAGTLAREQTLRLQSAADSLLLLTARARRSEATAKLYEYLGAARPILVLGETAAAATVVREARAGLVTSADDPQAISSALERLLEMPPSAFPSTRAAESYAYPRLAEQLIGLVERVIAGRSSRP